MYSTVNVEHEIVFAHFQSRDVFSSRVNVGSSSVSSVHHPVLNVRALTTTVDGRLFKQFYESRHLIHISYKYIYIVCVFPKLLP